jgi:integrase
MLQSTKPARPGTLKRVGQGLYRYTASGVYFAHVRIGGKLFRESLKTKDRRDAEQRLAEFRRQKQSLDTSLGRLTLAALCDRYEATLGRLSPSSQKAKRGILERLKDEWPGGADHQLVRKIKPSDCETWLAHQATRIGRSHYNAYLQVVRDLFAFAVRDKAISENPAAHLKYLKRENPLRLTPTWEQFEAIVADIRAQKFNADAQQSADFVEFIGRAGLGQAETAALRWHDVDFANERLTTFRHKTRTGFAIPIYPQLRPLLEKLYQQRLANNDGRVFAISDAKKALANSCRRQRLPKFGHRSFRRMFITRAIEKGIDVKVIAEWQGHRDGGKLILDTYSHVRAIHSKRMAQLMVDSQPENVVEFAQRDKKVV